MIIRVCMNVKYMLRTIMFMYGMKMILESIHTVILNYVIIYMCTYKLMI